MDTTQDTAAIQTLEMAQVIVELVYELRDTHPKGEDHAALWMAMLAVHGIQAARYVECVSVRAA